MAKHGFRVFDSDLHVLEPADLWERYIDPKFRDRAPRGVAGESRLSVRHERSGRIYPEYGKFKEEVVEPRWKVMEQIYAESVARGFDGVSQLAAMDREGIDVAMMFPSRALYVLASESIETDLAIAIAEAFNNWMADFCSTDRKRMFGNAMLPIQDVDASIREARRCVKELGFRGVFIRPNPPRRGLYYHDRRYDPLWAELQELDVPLLFHEGSLPDLPYVGSDRFSLDDLDLIHLCSHPMEAQLAMASLMMHGALDRFPRMRVAFLEANCAWLPYWLWRMEENLTLGAQRPKTPLREQFMRQCFLSFEPDERPATQMLAEYDGNNLVFSTDYPHNDSRFPHAIETFLKLPIADEHKRKILWDNCTRLYGFAPDFYR